MIAVLAFLFFPFLILYIPIKYYRKNLPIPVTFLKQIAYSSAGSKMMAYILIAVGGFFHVVYFNTFPRDPGIMGSTALLIALCNVNKSQEWLETIRSNRKWWMPILIVILVTSFFRLLLPTSIMLAFTLECAFFLPGEKIKEYDEFSSLATNDKFINAYFA